MVSRRRREIRVSRMVDNVAPSHLEENINLRKANFKAVYVILFNNGINSFH